MAKRKHPVKLPIDVLNRPRKPKSEKKAPYGPRRKRVHNPDPMDIPSGYDYGGSRSSKKKRK